MLHDVQQFALSLFVHRLSLFTFPTTKCPSHRRRLIMLFGPVYDVCVIRNSLKYVSASTGAFVGTVCLIAVRRSVWGEQVVVDVGELVHDR